MNYIIYGAIPEHLISLEKSALKPVKKPLRSKAKKRQK